MFVATEMKDVIRVTPDNFHHSLKDSITTLLNRKLANKVNNWEIIILIFYVKHLNFIFIILRFFFIH